MLYEPPWPQAISDDALEELERLAQDQRWDDFAATFFAGLVSPDDLEDLRASDLWPPIVADARASVEAPTLLQIGTESPGELFVTDALAAVLPDCRIEKSRRPGARRHDHGARAIRGRSDSILPWLGTLTSQRRRITIACNEDIMRHARWTMD